MIEHDSKNEQGAGINLIICVRSSETQTRSRQIELHLRVINVFDNLTAQNQIIDTIMSTSDKHDFIRKHRNYCINIIIKAWLS